MESSSESNYTRSVSVVVLLALRFLATRSSETPVGDKTGTKQSSVSNNLALFLVVELKNTIKHIHLLTKLRIGRCLSFPAVAVCYIQKVNTSEK